jgi:preprotein translocase subunit SecG
MKMIVRYAHNFTTQRNRAIESAEGSEVFLQRVAKSLQLIFMKYLFILLLFTACKTKSTMQTNEVKTYAFRLLRDRI